MITNKQIEEYSYKLARRFEAINVKYVKLMAKHITDIGKMPAEDIQRVEQLARMRSNMDEVERMLQKECRITANQLNKMYNKTAKQLYKEQKANYEYRDIKQVPIGNNEPIQNYLTALKKATGETFFNIASTTAKSADYTKAIDKAIETIQSGLSNPKTIIRQTIIKQANNTLKVQYASGYSRRLDSAVRMNVMDGIRALRNEQMKLMGKEFGADGVEIDAHGLCAEDHINWQGKRYAFNKADADKYHVKIFDKESNTVKGEHGRPIGEMNCQHGITYIILAVNQPVYSKSQLKQMRDFSNGKVKIGNKTMTRYEANQYMRRLETEMRDVKTQLMASNTEQLQTKLNVLQNTYNDVANKADIVPRMNRASVPGYRQPAQLKKFVKKHSQK